MRYLFLFLLLLSFNAYTANAQPGSSAFRAGDEAPDFSGLDQEGSLLHLSEILKEGPVVLVFFRGEWCPYCNRHLSQLQDSLQILQENGARVIAVTPQLPENIDKTILKYRIAGINLEKANGNSDFILPVPATFIINQEQRISYIHYDPNYKSRSNVKTLLQELKRL